LALPYIPTLLTQKQMDQKDDMAIVKAPQHVSILSWNVIHLGPHLRLHVLSDGFVAWYDRVSGPSGDFPGPRWQFGQYRNSGRKDALSSKNAKTSL
jgi:hypothetical protein